MDGLFDSQIFGWLFFGLIVIIFVAILFSFSKVKNAIFWYPRFRERNNDMGQLAKDFNLSFNDGLSGFWSFIGKSMFHNIQLNDLQGTINNHSVEIKDMLYSLTSVVTWIAPGGFNDGNRKTIITVDGQQIKGGVKDFSLGNSMMLTTVNELRNLLGTLR
jgi:hypothetical protein